MEQSNHLVKRLLLSLPEIESDKFTMTLLARRQHRFQKVIFKALVDLTCCGMVIVTRPLSNTSSANPRELLIFAGTVKEPPVTTKHAATSTHSWNLVKRKNRALRMSARCRSPSARHFPSKCEVEADSNDYQQHKREDDSQHAPFANPLCQSWFKRRRRITKHDIDV